MPRAAADTAFLLWCLAAAELFGVTLVGTIQSLVVCGQLVELAAFLLGRHMEKHRG